MRPLYIFDIDGTLTLLGDRRKILEEDTPDKWDRFYARCGEDLPNKPIIQILEILVDMECDIYLFTGRRESERLITIQWLYKHTCIGFDMDHHSERLMMRPIGDFTKDSTLKQSWLDQMLPVDRERLVATFDDRQQVVDMWRSNGITCLQVDKGDF